MTEEVINNAPDAGAWKGALAGDNAEFKAALEPFADTGALFAHISKQSETPVDWRKAIAGDDADTAKALERFTDQRAFYDSWKQKDDYIRTGTKVTVPGENASPEVIDAWNRARGVPEAADGYQITAKPPEGRGVDEATKGLLKGVTERLFKVGAEPAVVNLAHELIYEQATATETLRETQLGEGPALLGKALEKAWPNKGERDQNVGFATAAAYQYIGPKGSPELDAFSNLEVRDADGRYWRLGDHPDVIQAFAKIGRATAEDPLFLEASGAGASGASVDEQIAEIMKLRDTDPKKYNAPETRERHNRLLAARARHNELHGGSRAA